MNTVRVTQLDGNLPNLALMRLAAWHRAEGDSVRWEKGTTRHFGEPDYDIVYGSAIFSATAKAVRQFTTQFPGAIVGGSGGDKVLRVEDIVPSQFIGLDYSGFPKFNASIGYAMRGCRFRCGFCIVPRQEGKERSNSVIKKIWRGAEYPKHIHLLDNDFFGNPEWRERVNEIIAGGYKVAINQGVNARLITDENAEAIVAMQPWDAAFVRRRLYTAWDNIGDEKPFFDGVDRLENAGWSPTKIMAYMLVGYDRRETWERIAYRFDRMVARGIEPYVMVFGGDDRTPRRDDYPTLKRFQRWVRLHLYRSAGDNPSRAFDRYDTKRVRVADAPLFDHIAKETRHDL